MVRRLCDLDWPLTTARLALRPGRSEDAACFAADVASRRVMEKIGLRLEGVFRGESLHRSGRWLDGASYAVLASAHRARILEP